MVSAAALPRDLNLQPAVDRIAENIDGSFRWEGFQDEEAANAHIQLIEELFPIGTNTRCEFLNCPSVPGTVLFIDIDKTTNICNASNGVPYLRRGAQNWSCPIVGGNWFSA